MSIKGFRSLQRLQSKLVNFTAEQSIDDALYATVQQINGKRGALDTVIHGGYLISVSPLTAAAGSTIRTIICTSHGAMPGDYITFTSSNIEVNVLSVPDPDTIITSHELSFNPVGLTFNVFRHVTPSYNSDGSLNVVASPSPGQATAANQALEIADLDAIKTSAASIDTKASTLATSANQSTANTSLSSIDTKLSSQATATNQSTANTSLSSIDTKLSSQATAANQTTANTSLGTIATNTGTTSTNTGTIVTNTSTTATNTSTTATNTGTIATNTTNANTLIGAVTETAPASDTASSGLNGRLQRIAQNITTLIAKFTTTANGLKVDGSAVTQPVSGTFWQSTQPVSIAGTVTTSSTNQSVAGTPSTAQITVGTSAVRATVAGTAPNAARKYLSVKPSKNNSGAIFIGGSGVTTANGQEIIGPDYREFAFDSGDYYVISDTAGQTVEIMEKV